MANGKLTLGKQSGGTLGLVFPDGVSNTEVVLPESGELVTKNYVDTQNDQNVKTSGNQTIAGVKTFSSTIAGSINGNSATVTNGVYTTGNQTIAGVKTFSSSPIVPTPTAGTQAANKAYVDSASGSTWVANDSRAKTALNASGTAPIYACRAWVNFNGTGTVAIRASGNVSSITDNGTGDYTVNFTTAMPDANYAVAIEGTNATDGTSQFKILASAANTAPTLMTSSQLRIQFASGIDANVATVTIFR